MAGATPRSSSATEQKLRILHVLRAPVGGLFRHVLDLTREQITRGHLVGIVTDSTTGGARANDMLDTLAPSLQLGLLRIPMPRPVHPADIRAAVKIARHAARLQADVIHGHGAKGGAYARLPALLPMKQRAIRAYTPHGGSFHARPNSVAGRSYMAVERLLAGVTDVFLFESAFIAQQFRRRIGPTTKLSRIVCNGLNPSEFEPVTSAADAAEFLCIGELRVEKGIDTLIDALALLSHGESRPRLMLFGGGPDAAKFAELAQARGVGAQVTFAGVHPARQAFSSGRVLVVPSRAESLPYIVLEAAAAQVPMIATDVGGINEIFGPFRDRLIAPNDPKILADALRQMLSTPPQQTYEDAQVLASFVRTKFKISDMADAVLAGYAEAIAAKYPLNSAPRYAFPSL